MSGYIYEFVWNEVVPYEVKWFPVVKHTSATTMPLRYVLPTTASVVDQCSHVFIDNAAIDTLCATHLQSSLLATPPQFDATLHYVAPNNPESTVQYLLLVDSLNFCFWPTPGLEYEHLALGLKAIVEADPDVLSTTRLMSLTEQQLAPWFAHPGPIPQLQERLRLVHEARPKAATPCLCTYTT